jgi:uncharacterized protein (DUF362 family)
MPSRQADNHALTRRRLISAAAATAACSLVGASAEAAPSRWAARPPKGFVRMALPGRVVAVHKGGSLDGVVPKASAARVMLERAMTELTGKSNVADAFAMFVHPQDKVAIKPNGIAGKSTMKMAADKVVVVEVVRALVALGVKPENITIYEQYPSFLLATRCITNKGTLELAPEFPKGVKAAVHQNRDATMDAISVGGIDTKYVRPFTDASVVINVTQLKDHGICGYTGAMKNITHGSNINPHDFHAHNASPQIAHLYAQDVVKSRVALHIKDAYQVIYDEGPIDRNPRRRVPHETLYVSTDPVALDVMGWKVVEKLRKDNGLPSLAAAGRAPTYLRVAGELGLGVYDEKRIRLREVRL